MACTWSSADDGQVIVVQLRCETCDAPLTALDRHSRSVEGPACALYCPGCHGGFRPVAVSSLTKDQLFEFLKEAIACGNLAEF